MVVFSAIYWKYMLFLQSFRWWALWLGDFIGYFFGIGCVQFYGWWFFQWKSWIDKSSFHVWWCGPLSFFVHYMKSSFEELLRDLQIISKELFLSSWNLVSTTNLNTAFIFGCAMGNGWCFFLEVPKESPKKCLGYGFRQGENWRKRLYFHRALEMKRPQTIQNQF